MARSRSASEYVRRKIAQTEGWHRTESSKVRYKQNNSRVHRRLEEGTTKWVHYSF